MRAVVFNLLTSVECLLRQHNLQIYLVQA